MIWPAAFLLCLGAFFALSLAMPKHHRAVFGRAPELARARIARAVGWTALLAALALCIRGFGTGYGLVVFTALMNMAAIIVALMLTWPDRWSGLFRKEAS